MAGAVDKSCWAVLLTLTAGLLACSPEPRPGSIPATEAESRPNYPSAKPLGELELPENCDILVEGERDVERALLDLHGRVVVTIEVVDGRKLEIVCPPNPADRKDVIVLAELASDSARHSLVNVVHWTVDLNPDPDIEKVYLDEATPGVPHDINDEDLAQYKAAWPDIIEWQQAAAGAGKATGDDARSRSHGPPPVTVLFMSGHLKWAEIVYTHEASKRKRRVTLNPRITRALAPGNYLLQVRFPEASTEWQDAGSFEVPAGATQLELKLVETPQLHAKVQRVE